MLAHIYFASESFRLAKIFGWFVYFTRGLLLRYLSEPRRIALILIHELRRLAKSSDLGERLRTLWIAAALSKQLKLCTDRDISELMAIVQDHFGIFEPEFAICYHARRRLMLRITKEHSPR
jgi:hypothetical protein